MSEHATSAPPLPRRSRLRGRLHARSSDGAAQELVDIYQSHYQSLYRYCRSIVRNDQDAQDALQSAITKAFAALAVQRRDIELRPWLFRIAHNESISLVRRRRDASELADVEDTTASAHDQVVERDDFRALRQDLATLSAAQRAALVLRELNGLSHAEIAQVLGSGTGAVKQSIYEARSALLEAREGREMSCSAIQRTLSDGDGRALRGRRVRAHLRACASCTAFSEGIGSRPGELAAIFPPLPDVVGLAVLTHALAGVGHATTHATSASLGLGVGAAGASGHAAGGLVATLGTKVAVAVTAAAVAAGGTVAVLHPGRHTGRHHKAHPRGRAATVTTGPGTGARSAPVPGARPLAAATAAASGAPRAAATPGQTRLAAPSSPLRPGRHPQASADRHAGATTGWTLRKRSPGHARGGNRHDVPARSTESRPVARTPEKTSSNSGAPSGGGGSGTGKGSGSSAPSKGASTGGSSSGGDGASQSGSGATPPPPRKSG